MLHSLINPEGKLNQKQQLRPECSPTAVAVFHEEEIIISPPEAGRKMIRTDFRWRT
jgi:hypothetical protein